MGLRAFFRRLTRKHISSTDFAEAAAKATVRVAVEPQTARPVLHKLRNDGLEASETKIRREFAFLLHFSTYMALEPYQPDASEVFEQCTEWLIVFLTREDLWFSDQTEELTQDYVLRQEQYYALWEDANRWPWLSTPRDLQGLCFRLARVPLHALADEPEKAAEAAESHMELMSYARNFYEKMTGATRRIWINLEPRTASVGADPSVG